MVFVVETIIISGMVSRDFFQLGFLCVFVCFYHLWEVSFPSILFISWVERHINHDGGKNSTGSQPAGTLSAVTPEL